MDLPAGAHGKLRRAVCLLLTAILLAVAAPPGMGQEYSGFRYESGKCVNEEGAEGRNEGYVGECGALRGRDLREAVLNEIDLSGADLHGARAKGIKLKDAVLVGVAMRNSEFDSADLRGADLMDAVMDRADLRLADLSGARLHNARLERAILFGALLRDADLTRADLRRADLREADLSYADLSRANLRGAIYNQRTVFPVTLTAQQAAARGMVYRP
jgi:uncharacterized protein YjbI with pentapeptide repeats